MEEEPNISFFVKFFHVERHHQKMTIMDPNSLSGWSLLILDLDDLVSYLLVDIDIVLPILEVLIPHIIKVLEIVEQRPDDILVEQQVWRQLL